MSCDALRLLRKPTVLARWRLACDHDVRVGSTHCGNAVFVMLVEMVMQGVAPSSDTG